MRPVSDGGKSELYGEASGCAGRKIRLGKRVSDGRAGTERGRVKTASGYVSGIEGAVSAG